MATLFRADTAIFDPSQHIKYWLRCLKTLLPTPYQSNDSTRMTLAFFTLSALDLLDALHTNTSHEERKSYVDWIYRCQHPDGGFRGFTGADMGLSRDNHNHHWDPANLAATYFALGSLLILDDHLELLAVAKCMNWIQRLQLKDGSFGEAVNAKGEIVGGNDVRYCYCAAAIRRILKHHRGSTPETIDSDIDVLRMEKFVLSLQVIQVSRLEISFADFATKNFEGGIGNAPFHEAHGTHPLAIATAC